MAVFNPDQNYSQQAAPAPIQFGSPNLNQYVQYYQDLVAANGGQPSWGAGNDLSGINRGGQIMGQVDYAPNIDGTTERGWGTNRGVQDMSTPDRFFASLAKFSDTIAGAGGFNGWDEAKSAGENIGSFITSLPTGMASAPFSGAASLYEGVTGKPVTQSNLESNQMAGEDLTGFQRMGAIGTGLFDTVGLFFGGSAEALNAARNVTRAARGKDVAAPIGAAASKFMGRGAGAIAVDTLEEGAEEASQSVMEDVRYDRLDEGSASRALESAVYGAAGGAIMSAGGQMVNSALGSSDATTSIGDETHSVTQSPVFEAQKNADHIDGGPISAGAMARRMEKQSDNRNVPGSANQVSATYTGDVGLLNAHVGVAAFKGIMQSGEEGSRDILAAKLGTDVKDLVRISQLPDNIATVELNNLLDNQRAAGNDVRITINRTPASNHQITADFFLDKFVEGNQIGLNRAAYTFFRSDVDGDQMMVYFNPSVESGNLLIQNLQDKVTGQENFDSDFVNVLRNPANIDKADSILGVIPELNSGGKLNDEVDRSINNIKKILRSDSANKANEFASAMSLLTGSVQKAIFASMHQVASATNNTLTEDEIANITRQSWISANIIVADYWNALESMSRDTFGEFETYAKKLTDEEKNIVEQASSVVGFDELVDTQAGELSDYSMMGLFAALGMRIESVTDLKNPFYRQFPEIYIAAHRSHYMDVGKTWTFNTYAKLAAMSFRMRDTGCDVQTAIEGIFRLAVYDGFMARKAELVEDDPTQYKKIFEEVYNKAVAAFNEAWKNAEINTGNNVEKLQGAPKAFKHELGESEFGDKWLEVFGDQKISDFISLPTGHEFSGGITWNLAAELATTSPSSYTNPFTFKDISVQNFWKTVLSAYGKKQSQIGTKINTSLDGFHDATTKLRDFGVFDTVLKDGVSSVAAEHIPALTSWIEAAVRHIGIDAAIYYNVDSVVGLLDTTWGKAMVSAMNASDFKNAVVSMRLSYIYREVFEGMRLIEQGEEDLGNRLIRKSIGQAKNISDLHMAIFYELTKNGTFTLLHKFTDLNTSWEDTVRSYELIMDRNAGATSFLATVYKTDDSIISLASLTNDLAIAERSANEALRKTNGFSVSQIKEIRSEIKTGNITREQAVQALKRYGREQYTHYSDHVLTAAVMSARHGDKQEVDKGTSSQAEMLMYMHQGIAQDGHLMSALDRINVAMSSMELANFSMSREAVISVILDPDARIRVYDQETGRFTYITQAKIYEEFGITGEDENENFLQLIEAVPQLITLFTPLRTDPLYVGSNAVMQAGMEMTPVEAINNYKNSDPKEFFEKELEMNAQNFLLNRPEFFRVFILSIDPKILSSTDPSYVRKEVRKHMKKWTDYFIWRASLPSGDAAKRASDIYAQKRFEEVWKNTESILSEISLVKDAIARGGYYNKSLRSAQDSIASSLIAEVLIKKIDNTIESQTGSKVDRSKIIINEVDGETLTLEHILSQHINNLPDIYSVLFQLGEFDSVIDGATGVASERSAKIIQSVFDAIDKSEYRGSDRDRINTALRKLRQKLGAKYDKTHNTWDYSGVDPKEVALLFSDGVAGAMQTTSNGGIILDKESFYGMTTAEAISSIEAIVEKTGYDLDFGSKERKAIEDAFDGNNVNAKRDLFLTYNNAILNMLLEDAASGTGVTINADVGYSTISSFDMVDGLASEFTGQLVSRGKMPSTTLKTPPSFTFHTDNPISVASATNLQFKMEGGSIAPGVAIDASMIKNVASSSAFDPNDSCGVAPVEYDVNAAVNNTQGINALNSGLVGMQFEMFDDNGQPILKKDGSIARGFIKNIETLRNRANRAGLKTIKVYPLNRCLCGGACSTCGTASKNPIAEIRHVTPGDVEAVLLKFMMEEMHLKRRKSVGKVREMLYSPEQIISGVSNPIALSVKSDTDFRSFVIKELSSYRDTVADAYLMHISDDDLIGLKSLSKLDMLVIANLTTPYFNLNMRDGSTVRINTKDLVSDEMIKSYEIDYALVESISFENISLNEAASRQMQVASSRLSQKKLKDPDFRASKSDFYRWSKEATDWRDVGELSIKEALNRVAEIDTATYAGAYLDTVPTAPMQLSGDTIAELQNMFDNSDEAVGFNVSDADIRAVTSATADVSQKFGDHLSGYALARYVPAISGSQAPTIIVDSAIKKSLSNALGTTDGKLNGVMRIRLENETTSSRTIDLIEDSKNISRHIAHAVKSRHAVLINEGLKSSAEEAFRSLHIVPTPVKTIELSSGQRFLIYDSLDPSAFDIASHYTDKVPVTTIDDPANEIGWALEDLGDFGTTDGQTFIHSESAKKLKFNVVGETDINVSELFSNIRFAAPYDEPHIASKTELKKAKVDGENANVDFSYWEKQAGGDISLESMQESVRLYLGNIGNVPESANFASNVSNGACIGLVKKGENFVPIFYYSGTEGPTNVNSIAFGIDDKNNISLKINADGGFESGSRKIGLYGVAYKSMATILTLEEEANWPAFETCGHIVFLRPDMLVNSATLSTRTAMKRKQTTCTNLYAYTRASGTNLFYDISVKNGEMVATKRKELNPKLTDDQIISLCEGDPVLWTEVISGTLDIFNSSHTVVNAAIARMAGEVAARTGNWRVVAGFFSSRFYSEGALGKENNFKLYNKWCEPQAIFKNMNLNDVLLVFNMLDPNLCPPGVGHTDTMKTVFDDQGRILVNTKKGLQRFVAIGGPHYFTDQASEMKDYSRSASYSMQTVVMSMLNSGIFNKEVENLINYLGLQVGETKPLSTKSIEDIRKDLDTYHDDWDKNINEGLLKRVELNIGDPVLIEKAFAYRQKCKQEHAGLMTPIGLIASSTDQTNALDPDLHPDMPAKIDRLVSEINKALQIENAADKITVYELLILVKYQMGYSYNSGEFTSITFDQLQNCVEKMKESISKTGLPVLGGKYTTSRNDTRVGIDVLMPDMARRLWNASPIYHEDTERGYSTYEDFVQAMFDNAEKNTMRQIAAIKDNGKRMALMRMVDAVAYAHGRNTISGHILESEYIDNLIEFVKISGPDIFKGFDIDVENVLKQYDESKTVSKEFLQKAEELAEERLTLIMEDDLAWGGVTVNHKSTEENMVGKVLRNLVSLRQIMGVMYVEMPVANGAERAFNQGAMSLATHLGTLGSPLYKNTKHAIDPELKYNVTHADDVKKLWAALREAQLHGIEKELIAHIRDAQDVNAAINEFFEKQGKFESFANRVMNYASAKNFLIEGQIGLFLDRFAMRIEDEAPWWGLPNPSTGETMFHMQLRTDPVKLIVGLLNGTASGTSADALMSRECFNWALRGDMAQKNLFSAIYAEIAKRSASSSFFMTAFVTPYFNYATNRFGRIMQWVMPVSTMHHLLVKYFTQGYGAGWKVPGLDITFGELVLEDTQLTKDMKEAVTLDMLHLGPQLIAIMLLGMGALEPPEDEDKWGNFKEWTIFGARVDANWWLEDMLGLAIPYAAFGASCARGKPRVDLITNGIAYYLSNNPVVKVSDAIEVLFDPMAELTQLYEKDIEGYAKAMGGPPSFQDVLNGRMTSFGLSTVAQFITPGALREIYNQGQRYEASYKRIFQEGQYGKLTSEGEQGEKTQYTEYHDAIVRKYTRNNPVMGFLADMILRPETGYMAHEMPRNVIYDPYQMDALNYFSIYNDPFTKSDEKTDIEKEAIAIEAIGVLQTYSIDELKQQGFALDYDTKEYVSKYIWDIIANLNAQYQEFQNSDASNFYYWGSFEEGKAVVNEIKSAHYALVDSWKTLYRDKLWSDELTIAKYNRLHTNYAVDDNGNVYATGYYPNATIGGAIPWPITFAPGESPGPYQQNMGRENDWQTESIVTATPTGERGLVPLASEMGKTPSIDSWSTDGTDTGLSDRAANKTGNQPSGGSPSGGGTDDSGIPAGSSGSRRTRGGSSGGGRSGGGSSYSRSSGGSGGGGGGSFPNIYSHVNAPNISNPDTMRGARNYDANYDALRPNFTTKGSREAYKRSDI